MSASAAAASSSSSSSAAPAVRRPIRAAYAETWWFSSEGTFMYPLSRRLCPPLRAVGVLPNHITLFNVLIGLSQSLSLASRWWLGAVVLLVVHQLLDAMDGTMARTYKLCTPLGAKLDEATDILFGATVSLAGLWISWPDPLIVTVLLVVAGSILAGALAWSEGGSSKRYIDELTWLEWVRTLLFVCFFFWRWLCACSPPSAVTVTVWVRGRWLRPATVGPVGHRVPDLQHAVPRGHDRGGGARA